MKCSDICDKLSLYIDNELSHAEMLQMEGHLQECENCQKELEEYRNIISVLQSLPEEEPPEGYCKRLHKKLLESIPRSEAKKASSRKIKQRSRWLKYGSIAAALVLVAIVSNINSISNLGAKSESSDDGMAPMAPAESSSDDFRSESIFDVDMATAEEAGEYARGRAPSLNMAYVEEREMKIVKSGTIYSQTEDYNIFLDDLSKKLDSFGGFLESNNTEVYHVYDGNQLMYGNLKIRVPQENFYQMVEYLENNTDVRRKNIKETDLTKEYYEKDNKVKNLEIQEDHLRDLFDQASTVEEILLIENELRRVRTEIDALNISLGDIDYRAAMSTIDLEVEEVVTASLKLKTNDSVWDRSKNGFINTINRIIRTLENLFVYLIANSPILIPIIILVIIVVLKIRRRS